MKGSFVLFLALFFSYVAAQSYLSSPPARQPAAASTTGPCGTGTYVLPYNISAGRFIPTTWTADAAGQGQGTTVYFNLLDDAENLLYNIDNATFTTQSFNLRIPSATPVGIYTLQWMWPKTTTTIYYSCTKINVTPDLINATVVYLNTPFTDFLYDTLEYYEVHRPTDLNPMLVTAQMVTGPGPLSLFAMAGLINVPNATNYMEMGSTAATGVITMGLCPTSSAWFIAAEGPAGVVDTETFSMTIETYDGLQNVATPPKSIPPHTGNRYFVTQSYESTESPRRFVVRSSQPHTANLQLATTCNFNTGLIIGTQVSDSVSCIQLGKNAGNKYIRVGPMVTDYTITTENGICAEAAGVALKVSMTLLFLCFFLFSLF